jgi:hypothetical protein
MIVGRGFQAEDHMGETMLDLQDLGLQEELLEAFGRIVKEQSLEKGLPRRRPEEGVMAILADIQAHDQILSGASNLCAQLTECPVPDKLRMLHAKPPLRDCEQVDSYSDLLTGGFLFEKRKLGINI